MNTYTTHTHTHDTQLTTVRCPCRYLKAAENSHLESQFKVGAMLSAGSGVEKNEKDGFDWYMQAAQAGLAEAQNKVGLAYRTGCGVTVRK